MARRTRKQSKSTSVFGALVIEGLAVVVFLFLFVQARAERQRESELEPTNIPVIQQLFEQTPFEQTPFQDLLAQNRTLGQQIADERGAGSGSWNY